jgi:hypothetical protein
MHNIDQIIDCCARVRKRLQTFSFQEKRLALRQALPSLFAATTFRSFSRQCMLLRDLMSESQAPGSGRHPVPEVTLSPIPAYP